MTDEVCQTGKIQYPTSGAASLAAKHLKSRDRGRTAPANPYRCPFCSGWHRGRDNSAAARKLAERRARAERLGAPR